MIEKGKIDSIELAIQRTNVRLLYQRITAKNNIIREYQEKDSLFQKAMNSFKRENANLLDQIAVANEAVMKMQREIRRQKRRTWLTWIVTGKQ